ncbi:MAG: calcium/sodium antiporter [Tagaea sp.]|nr:calcium/sodium antiporter [Tagaea sp.]
MGDIVWLVLGLAVLVAGGELLVRGSVAVAERLGVSPLMIGLTLVGFGTSTPELVTSVQAALIGSPGIAVGNIVGSNIANILLILGLSAMLAPVAVTTLALKRDGTFVVFTALLVVLLPFVGALDRAAGAVFVALLAAYLVYAYRQEKAGAPAGHTAAFDKGEALEEALPHRGKGAALAIAQSLGIAVAGLALVVVGGKVLVDAAVGLARGWGISETVIGLTIVAVGTSMPELVTSIMAALRKQSDLALGNVLGSNIYNVLGIGGLTGLISPTAIPVEIARFDAPVMLAVSVLLMVFAWTGFRIGRREGAALVTCYGAYIWIIWPA